MNENDHLALRCTVADTYLVLFFMELAPRCEYKAVLSVADTCQILFFFF